MKITFLIGFFGLLGTVLGLPDCGTQEDSQFGVNDYIEYIPGSLPVVLAAPHGGYEEPDSIPDRNCTGCSYLRDSYTQELAVEVADLMLEEFGARPHLIICHLARIKMDANREPGEAALGNAEALQAWKEFHYFVGNATATVGTGLFIDVHGQAHSEGWLELGYLLSGTSDLPLSDEELNDESIVETTSVRSIVASSGLTLAELVRGNRSLGALWTAESSYSVVPSPDFPDPDGGNYYSGGFDTKQYGSRDGGSVDGVQFEFPYAMRENYETTAAEMVVVLDSFMSDIYGMSLEDYCVSGDDETNDDGDDGDDETNDDGDDGDDGDDETDDEGDDEGDDDEERATIEMKLELNGISTEDFTDAVIADLSQVIADLAGVDVSAVQVDDIEAVEADDDEGDDDDGDDGDGDDSAGNSSSTATDDARKYRRLAAAGVELTISITVRESLADGIISTISETSTADFLGLIQGVPGLEAVSDMTLQSIQIEEANAAKRWSPTILSMSAMAVTIALLRT